MLWGCASGGFGKLPVTTSGLRHMTARGTLGALSTSLASAEARNGDGRTLADHGGRAFRLVRALGSSHQAA